jgi:hypothetical protein
MAAQLTATRDRRPSNVRHRELQLYSLSVSVYSTPDSSDRLRCSVSGCTVSFAKIPSDPGLTNAAARMRAHAMGWDRPVLAVLQPGGTYRARGPVAGL